MKYPFKLSRRTVLGSVLGGATCAFGGVPTLLQASGPRPLVLLVDGIDPATDANQLFTYLDPIISQDIPVGCVLRLDPDAASAFQSNPELAQLLLRLKSDYPGLIELILDVPGLAEAPGFLRMRKAGDAQSAYLRAMAPFVAAGQNAPTALSLVTELPEGVPPVLEGIRSAGFRNAFMLPDAPMETTVWMTGDGAQQVHGGTRVEDATVLQRVINRDITGASPVVLIDRMPNDPNLSEDDLFLRAAEFGDVIAGARRASRSFLTLPADMVLRSGQDFQRTVILCIDQQQTADIPTTFAKRLQDAGIVYTIIRSGSPDAADAQDLQICWQTSPDKGTVGADAIKSLAAHDIETMRACVAVEDTEDQALAAAFTGLDTVIDTGTARPQITGLDRRGVLSLHQSLRYDGASAEQRSATILDLLAKTGGPLDDRLMVVPGDALLDPSNADVVAAALIALASDANTVITDVAGYTRAVTVNDQPAALLKVAQRVPGAPLMIKPETEAHDKLRQDAELAWSYFELLTEDETGFVPATAWREGAQIETYDFATMWDIGSLIHATISAHTIGLITDAEFGERLTRALASIQDGAFGALTLPRGFSSTTRQETGREDYNATDTARLLIALKVLEDYSDHDFGTAGLVARWNLAETIRDGVPHTIIGDEFESAYQSNYAGYIMRAFALWGFDVASPFPPLGSLKGLDADVATLHAAASLGPIGTEPHLLEAIELGYSDTARALAEALFAAQIMKHAATGNLVCVSEAPINQAPWFIYNGYQLGATEAPWTAETSNDSTRYTTRGFRRSVERVNAKAAFLWHAVRSGDYTARLVAHIREFSADPGLGFSPGVLTISHDSSRGYSDINTNAIILQAIAYGLNDARPAIAWRAE